MSILSGPAIRAAVDRGDIVVDPYRPEHVNPASIDLTLGGTMLEYPEAAQFDCKGPMPRAWETKSESFFNLYPRVLYLMHTAERVCTDRYVPEINGKSSIGRVGMQVHMTAGLGDPGFDGQYTLEVTVVCPARVYVGMRICQILFHEIVGDIEPYKGNYTGEASMGPVPSRVYKQFEGK